jgi:acetyl esterase
MPLDPQAQAMIARFAGGKPVEEMTPDEMRASLEERVRLTGGEAEPIDRVVDGQVARPGGHIPVRIYAPASERPLPGLVFLHGGGWARGSLDTHDRLCRSLANGAGCIVVSVDYRMAPEHRFPAALDDSATATRWVASNAANLGIDPDRLAVGGDSAGGNLAAAVTLVLREEGGPRLTHQLLIYPVTDFNFDTISYKDNATGYMLTRSAMRHYWALYLADASDGANYRASPLRATDFGKLPPATILTAEYDPLRDEGLAYAERLRAAGVAVRYLEYPGLIHGFATSAGALDRGRDAVQDAAAALREAFQLDVVGA